LWWLDTVIYKRKTYQLWALVGYIVSLSSCSVGANSKGSNVSRKSSGGKPLSLIEELHFNIMYMTFGKFQKVGTAMTKLLA
jgi:hypothetical protein